LIFKKNIILQPIISLIT